MRYLLALVILSIGSASLAQPRLPLILSDGAVLQRGQPVPVWGWAAPGSAVTVHFGDATAVAEADADSLWRVEVPTQAVGGPYTLTVAAEGDTLTVENLLVGDVWVLSGQSNMQWAVKDSRNAEAEIAAASDDGIRHFRVPRSFAEEPVDDLTGGAWESAQPEVVGDFSAVGYFFARDLRTHVEVPIGLIHTSWGGSRIEPWMSAAMLGYDPEEVEAVLEEEREAPQEAEARVRKKMGGSLPETDPGLVDGTAHWAAPDLDTETWPTIRVPSTWESAGYPRMDGIGWYRTTLTLTDDEAAQDATLSLGRIDDGDITYVNGVEVGRMDRASSVDRVYPVPASVLRAGENVVAVRVTDSGGGGGMKGGSALVYVETADGARRSLASDAWRFHVGPVRFDGVGNKNKVPMLLWNQMVHPLTQAPVAGVLWYQGESNGGNEADATAYGPLFRSLITGWREAWGQPALPFFWVQLAGYRAPPDGPSDTGVWPTLRQSQTSALALDRTAEVLAYDVGEADDIHPRDKQTVGHRLALAARALVYGEHTLTYAGPRYRSHTVERDRVAITFDHVGGGLATRNGDSPGGFAIAGADGTWHWAEARLDGDRVVVWSEAVPSPVAVRYAWADNPTSATLTDAGGLPASPFSVSVLPR